MNLFRSVVDSHTDWFPSVICQLGSPVAEMFLPLLLLLPNLAAAATLERVSLADYPLGKQHYPRSAIEMISPDKPALDDKIWSGSPVQ